MSNPFSKYIIRDKTAEIVHSSAYGKAQNGSAFGTASTESFETRREIDQNRTYVRGYGDSRVINDSLGNAPRPKTYTPPTSPLKIDDGKTTRAQYSAQNANAARFASKTNVAGSTQSSTPTSRISTSTPPARKNPGIFR